MLFSCHFAVLQLDTSLSLKYKENLSYVPIGCIVLKVTGEGSDYPPLPSQVFM